MIKQWKYFGPNPPCNPRVMVRLPDIERDQVYVDRRTDIIWRYNTFDQWSFFRLPPKRKRDALR